MNDLLQQLIAERIALRDAAQERLRERGIELVATITSPPSDEELRHDAWYAMGCLNALEDLRDELNRDVAA